MRRSRAGRLRELSLPYARHPLPALLALLGFVLLVELASFTTIGAAQGKAFKIGWHARRPTDAVALGHRGRRADAAAGLWLRLEAAGSAPAGTR